MQPQMVDEFMHQTRIAMHISARDFYKRILSAGFILGVSYFAGILSAGLQICAAIILFEVPHHILNKSISDRKGLFSVSIAIAYWGNCMISIIPYLAFSFLLSFDSSHAYQLGAYIWLFASYVHISNTFGLLSFYNWSLMVPAFGTAFLLFRNSADMTLTQSTTTDWVVVSAMMGGYIYNTIGTLSNNKDTETALSRARAEANSRLLDLEYLSQHDKLTGLQNRGAFDDALTVMLNTANLRNGLTVYLIDLDNFKPINDSYSHLAGDTVLVAVAESLKRVAGPDAIVSRLGGDEFAIAMPNIPSDAVSHKLGTYLLRAIEAPIMFNQKQLRVGASVGIARTDQTEQSASELCANADQAMFYAKADPEESVVLFNASNFPARYTLEDRNALSRAIHDQQIRPFYQPKVSLSTGQIVGFEALARWNHPNRGLLAPLDFMHLVTESGLHGDLLINMTRQVLTDIDRILAAGLSCGQMSINVPEVTLATLSGRSDLSKLIDQFSHVRHCLTFEITEDVFIARSCDMIKRSIDHFRQSGIRVSLDDFGTGFASFQHLRMLEFDEMKLDTSFVQGLGVDPSAGVLVESFLSIGRGLGVQIVAEGVETNAQLTLLRQMGCEVVQGHLFGAAIPITDTIKLLEKGISHPSIMATDAA